jgi:hypothetical protein
MMKPELEPVKKPENEAISTSDPGLFIRKGTSPYGSADTAETVSPVCGLCGAEGYTSGRHGEQPTDVLFAPAQTQVDPDGWHHNAGICRACTERAAKIWTETDAPRHWFEHALLTGSMQELLNGAVALQVAHAEAGSALVRLAQLDKVDAAALIVELTCLKMSLEDPDPDQPKWQAAVERRMAAVWDLLTQARLAGITNLKVKP